MNKYVYLYDDEIMAECRQRKAELRERYVNDEAYNKHLDEERPRLEAEGWHFVTPEEHAERIAWQNNRQRTMKSAGRAVNEYVYSYDDEIMAEYRQRKAELREGYVDDAAYNKHLDEERPYWEAHDRHFETPEKRAERLAWQNDEQRTMKSEGRAVNKYAYPYDDEIMAECRQRNAELRERYVDDEGYNKHLDEERPRLEAEGWHFVTPEEHAARIARQNGERGRCVASRIERHN
jgi:hypothetical protein